MLVTILVKLQFRHLAQLLKLPRKSIARARQADMDALSSKAEKALDTAEENFRNGEQAADPNDLRVESAALVTKYSSCDQAQLNAFSVTIVADADTIDKGNITVMGPAGDSGPHPRNLSQSSSSSSSSSTQPAAPAKK